MYNIQVLKKPRHSQCLCPSHSIRSEVPHSGKQIGSNGFKLSTPFVRRERERVTGGNSLLALAPKAIRWAIGETTNLLPRVAFGWHCWIIYAHCFMFGSSFMLYFLLCIHTTVNTHTHVHTSLEGAIFESSDVSNEDKSFHLFTWSNWLFAVG